MGQDVDLDDRRVARKPDEDVFECVSRQARALTIVTIGQRAAARRPRKQHRHDRSVGVMHKLREAENRVVEPIVVAMDENERAVLGDGRRPGANPSIKIHFSYLSDFSGDEGNRGISRGARRQYHFTGLAHPSREEWRPRCWCRSARRPVRRCRALPDRPQGVASWRQSCRLSTRLRRSLTPAKADRSACWLQAASAAAKAMRSALTFILVPAPQRYVASALASSSSLWASDSMPPEMSFALNLFCSRICTAKEAPERSPM